MLKGNILSATMEVLRQVHRELQVDQEDLDPDNNNEDSVEVPVSTAVGHSGAMEDSALGEQTEQVSLPPEDKGIPVDGKQVVRFVNMALTPRESCSLLLECSLVLIRVTRAWLPTYLAWAGTAHEVSISCGPCLAFPLLSSPSQLRLLLH